MKRIIIATSNEGKMKEFRRLLAHKNVEILSMHEAGIDIDIDENGTTFEENAARQKPFVTLPIHYVFQMTADLL